MLSTVNAHTHLELTGLSHLCPSESEDLGPWMNRVVRHMKCLTRAQIQVAIQEGISELKASGTTHVGDVSATWQSLALLHTSGLQGVVYLEIRGLHRTQALKKLEQAKSVIDRFRRKNHFSSIRVGLSLHSPYSCHSELLKKGAAWCRNENVPLCMHVSESPVETKLIQRGRVLAVTGKIGEMLKLTSILSLFLPKWRPISYLDSLGILEAHPLLVHCIHLKKAEIRRVADTGCAVVHCPRSNKSLSCGRMPLERFHSAGVPVYLGTDSRASSPSLDVHDEVEFAERLHRDFVDPDKIQQMIHNCFYT